jgi:hypothetical protein
MSPKTWGPPIWTLFHTLAEKIKEDKFNSVGPQVFRFITSICNNLPCPECTSHAKSFLSKVDARRVNSKKALQDLLFIFHNIVNKRKNKHLFKYIDFLTVYKSKNVVATFNEFTKVYKTDGNMKLMTENFHRKFLINAFKKWFILNLDNFDRS